MERWSFVRFCLAVLSLSITAATVGCAEQVTPDEPPPGTVTSSSGSAGGEGGSGGAGGVGGDPGPCADDCSMVIPPPCYKTVCNAGQLPGPVGSCVVVADDGATCDDGLFCTTGDSCLAGDCLGVLPNDCGMTAETCTEVVCDEGAAACSLAPSANGALCVSDDLCVTGAICTDGECAGAPKDCFFSPHTECNIVACNPANGLCEPTMPDPTKTGMMCSQTGDKCQINRTCDAAGMCAGGTPKDCSSLSVGCQNGLCEPGTGVCIGEAIPEGATCLEATDQCNVGICDANASCLPTPVVNGTSCNDFDSCTGGDTCTAGACDGMPVFGCELYFEDNLENGCPPPGWTLGGDWECGTPAGPGPGAAYEGATCLGTQIDGNYNNNQTYAMAIAQTPPIDLGTAIEPVLQFATWISTESCCDGVNLKISNDGGATFSALTSVTPAYNLNVGLEAAWGGTVFATGWQIFTADLAAYAGQSVILRFSFRSDFSNVGPGAYIDDLLVTEAVAIPLMITTSSLPDGLVGSPYTAQVAKTGGTIGSTWSIVGGMNHGWLTIDPATGTLSGTPIAANLGPFSVTVRVEEPLLPSNFFEKVLTGSVLQGLYGETFEGACPNGWTLTGDWECGTPINVGPATAYDGLQCLGTQIDSNYNNSQPYASTTATSPLIDLTTTVAPQLHFRMWVVTEGSTYDGANLKISTNGVIYSQVMNVNPPYNLTVDGEPAWGGNMSALGWQLVTADLTAYAGQTVYLRYAFRTDGSGVHPGVYIDSILIAE